MNFFNTRNNKITMNDTTKKFIQYSKKIFQKSKQFARKIKN